jgi:cell division protein FtsW (lipid II flippase)
MERNDKWWWWIVSFAVATACSFIVVADKPTVGLSGVLFVACGVVTTKDGVRWKPLLQMLLFMAVTLFVSSVAVYLHFICLFAGVLIGCACAVTDEIKRKERMYGN